MKQTNQPLENLPAIPITEMISPFNAEAFKQQFLTAVKTEFGPYLTKATELANTAGTMKIETSGDLESAKGRILDTASWVKLLETTHKNTKAPLKILVDILDSEKKKIIDTMEVSKKIISSKITFKETLDSRAKKETLRAALVEKQKQDQLVLADTQTISRIVSNIRAMLFGGEMITAKGITQRPGCFTLDEIAIVENIVSQKLPGMSTFHVNCVDTYQKAITAINDLVIARKTAIMEGRTTLTDAEISVISDSTEIITAQQEQIAKENHKAEVAIEQSQKGFRREIKYDVIDINRIPREYLTLNESKLNEYKVLYREQILEQLKADEGTGHGFIEGLRFRVEQTSIIR